MADPQEKYNRIITLLLEKVGEPLDKTDRVIARICELLEASPPPPDTVEASEKAELIVTTLSKADRVAKGLAIIESALDDFLNPKAAALRDELEDLSAFTNTIAPAKPVPSGNIHSLLDNIANTGLGQDYVIASRHSDEPVPDYTKGHRNFFFEDKVYTAPNGERRVLRTQATHDFVPTVHADDLMGPRRPGSKISYDDFAIEDPRRKRAHTGYSYGAVIEEPKPSAVVLPVKPNPVPVLSPQATMKPTTTTTDAAKPGPASKPAPAPAASGGDDGPIDIVIPKWAKGPPSTDEEITEYKKFMIAKYEAEAKYNAEVLRRKKLKDGK